jgi:hypothetical protein
LQREYQRQIVTLLTLESCTDLLDEANSSIMFHAMLLLTACDNPKQPHLPTVVLQIADVLTASDFSPEKKKQLADIVQLKDQK